MIIVTDGGGCDDNSDRLAVVMMIVTDDGCCVDDSDRWWLL